MLSRINSTGRLRVTRDMASFACVTDSVPPAFVGEIDLTGLADLPADAQVFVEAHRQSIIERFDFGTVAATAARGPTELRELTHENLQFRIKVVERGSGKLLALGDRFTPDDAEHGGRQPLLKVREADIGPEPWRTAIEEDAAVLILNEKIPDAIGKLTRDPAFQALILPAAFRQILLRMWVARQDEEEDPEDDDWQARWLRFARSLAPAEELDWDDEEAVPDWIDACCEGFARRHDFLSVLAGEAE